jgi:hypothetical protein
VWKHRRDDANEKRLLKQTSIDQERRAKGEEREGEKKKEEKRGKNGGGEEMSVRRGTGLRSVV